MFSVYMKLWFCLFVSHIKQILESYLDILCLIKKKEIENIFKNFKHEIRETIANVGTKHGVRLCFIEIIFVSLIPTGSFIPNTF